jgi:hypothetical protein
VNVSAALGRDQDLVLIARDATFGHRLQDDRLHSPGHRKPPDAIRLADYPLPREIVRSTDPSAEVTPANAFAIYEHDWRHFNHASRAAGGLICRAMSTACRALLPTGSTRLSTLIAGALKVRTGLQTGGVAAGTGQQCVAKFGYRHAARQLQSLVPAVAAQNVLQQQQQQQQQQQRRRQRCADFVTGSVGLLRRFAAGHEFELHRIGVARRAHQR